MRIQFDNIKTSKAKLTIVLGENIVTVNTDRLINEGYTFSKKDVDDLDKITIIGRHQYKLNYSDMLKYYFSLETENTNTYDINDIKDNETYSSELKLTGIKSENLSNLYYNSQYLASDTDIKSTILPINVDLNNIKNINSVTFPWGLEIIEKDAIKLDSNIKNIYVPKTITEIHQDSILNDFNKIVFQDPTGWTYTGIVDDTLYILAPIDFSDDKATENIKEFIKQTDNCIIRFFKDAKVTYNCDLAADTIYINNYIPDIENNILKLW